MFSCVWLHFKKCFEKYFLMFGCVLENTIENTFSTCCSHFLTFSRFPNEYIISFIPQNTNKTQKKIIKSGHFAQSRSARRRDHDRRFALRTIAIEASRNRDRRDAGDVGGRWRAWLWTISLSLSLSLFSIFQDRKSFEVKMETKMIFRCFGSHFRSTENAFQFDQIWSNNQTSHFSENHFRN